MTSQPNSDRYAIYSIAMLNNFLRAYCISANFGAKSLNCGTVKLPRAHSYGEIIDEFVRIGNPRRYRAGNMGLWRLNDEPAFHVPRIFLNIVSVLNISNIMIIQNALIDSWRVDVLRSIRNYYSHKNRETEANAIASVNANYSIRRVRGGNLLLENDSTRAMKVVEDIHTYLIDFATSIT
jgi:hypothetical protein